MADYDSSLPVRSEADGTDERVHVKIVDESTPSQMATVDTDKNLHIEAHGNDPSAVDRILRLSELGAVNPDGDYDGTNNTKPASIGLIVHDRTATPADTDQNFRVTGVTGTDPDATHHCMDVSLHDELGNQYDADNPLPVTFEESEGTEVIDYDTGSAVAKDAISNHDYSVADATAFFLKKVWASASGKLKIEVQIGDGEASEVFSTIFVGFNSTANPNIEIDLDGVPYEIADGGVNTTTVRIIRTNLDNQSQDVYSTILGISR